MPSASCAPPRTASVPPTRSACSRWPRKACARWPTPPSCVWATASPLLSSVSNVALPPDRVYFREVSLSGAVRPAGHVLARLKEAQKLGFKQAILPSAGEFDANGLKLTLSRAAHVRGLAEALG